MMPARVRRNPVRKAEIAQRCAVAYLGSPCSTGTHFEALGSTTGACMGWRLQVLMIAETAKAIRVDPRTVRKLLRSGRLQGFEAGKVVRVTADSVERLMRGESAEPRDAGNS